MFFIDFNNQNKSLKRLGNQWPKLMSELTIYKAILSRFIFIMSIVLVEILPGVGTDRVMRAARLIF
jgi:hypothetical protein